MTDQASAAKPKRRRGFWDVFFFVFQTLPVIVALVILSVATVAYTLIRWVL